MKVPESSPVSIACPDVKDSSYEFGPAALVPFLLRFTLSPFQILHDVMAKDLQYQLSSGCTQRYFTFVSILMI